MKRLALLLASAALVAPISSAWADTVSQSVSNTIAKNATRRGYSIEQAVLAVQAANAEVAATGGAGRTSWLDWFKNIDTSVDGLLWPFSLAWADRDNSDGIFSEGGSFGGGGATGSWDSPHQLHCSQWKLAFDAAGNLVVPSIQFPPGEALTIGGDIYRLTTAGLKGANSPGAAALWWRHNMNEQYGSDQRRWLGVWLVTTTNGTNTYNAANQAVYDAAGALQSRITASTVFTSSGYNINNGINKNCPEQQGAGGDFHFYIGSSTNNIEQMDTCTWYAPQGESGLGSNGYRYPDTVAIPVASFDSYVNNFPAIAACPLDPAMIARVADILYKRASEKPGYDGPPRDPSDPVRKEDVCTEQDPRGKDLAENPSTLPAPNPDCTPPKATGTPTPTPTPTSTPGGGIDLGPDPGVGSPDLGEAPTGLMDPIFDWLPDLPSITLNTGAAQCPTWEAQPYPGPEWHLVVDAHCPFIEDNRAAIGALMIVVFTLGAAAIIIRA